MSDEPTRNWSTKTLARQLIRYLKESHAAADWTVSDLLDSLKSAIVTEEVGEDLEL